MSTTLNVRMSAPAKARGDSVLKRFGIGTSEAVRALWAEMAATGTVPDFIRERTTHSKDKDKKIAALNALASSPKTEYSHMSDEELERIYGARYE